jgi:3-ketosteroid 9alpha-monooxygenase subunit B
MTNGLDVPYSCRAGECGSCSCVLVEGEVTMANNEVLDADDLAAGFILGCQARPRSMELKIEF